ncbi:CBO0543 family protein [Paenibacillus puerhi]|uniref:CBO0543 family protein n=1 Tax=Paenibacillus puerhi TaxID=2692622 RepID=UPI00135A7848|nr:CBO0543 family protein [Paenibacillus puerhi]
MTGLTVICFFRSKRWRQSGRYHSTALYIMLGSLLYIVLTAGYVLWSFVPDIPMLRLTCELFYSLLVFPLTALMFLNGYPEGLGRVRVHYLKWIGCYAGIELVLMWTGRIEYGNGWNWYCSVLFDFMMFPMLRLHSRRPLVAYACSVPIIIGLLLLFRVPLSQVSEILLPSTHPPAN